MKPILLVIAVRVAFPQNNNNLLVTPDLTILVKHSNLSLNKPNVTNRASPVLPCSLLAGRVAAEEFVRGTVLGLVRLRAFGYYTV